MYAIFLSYDKLASNQKIIISVISLHNHITPKTTYLQRIPRLRPTFTASVWLHFLGVLVSLYHITKSRNNRIIIQLWREKFHYPIDKWILLVTWESFLNVFVWSNTDLLLTFVYSATNSVEVKVRKGVYLFTKINSVLWQDHCFGAERHYWVETCDVQKKQSFT